MGNRMSDKAPILDRVGNRLTRHLARKDTHIAPGSYVVSFTFDDVPETALINGAPILEDAKARGTFYVSGSLSGTRSGNQKMLTIAQQRELHERGHEIACHTYSHINVGQHSARSVMEDVDKNADYFSQVADDLELDNFAYPYAVSSPLPHAALKRQFVTCRGGLPGVNIGNVDRGYLFAIDVRRDSSLEELTYWVDKARASSGWLIFFTHDVGDDCTEFGCQPGVLRSLTRYCQKSNFEILTIKNACKRLVIGGSRRETN